MSGTIDDATKQDPQDFEGEYWATSDQGIVKIGIWNDALRLSPLPAPLTVTASHPTMQELFAGEESRISAIPFGSGVWGCAFYQKQVFHSAAKVVEQPQLDGRTCE